MMNEASNACAPKEAPAILAAAEGNEKMLAEANCRLENILHRLRGDLPKDPSDSGAEPACGLLEQHTKCMRRRLRILCRGIEELDSLI